MGTASKLFWKTLQGPEVKPVELYFGILNSDSKSNNFQKMLKKKVVSVVPGWLRLGTVQLLSLVPQNAVIGLRLKPSSRRELMIMYIHWSDSQKRLIAYVAELRNYLVREMQVSTCTCACEYTVHVHCTCRLNEIHVVYWHNYVLLLLSLEKAPASEEIVTVCWF